MNHFYHEIHGWFDYQEVYDIAIGTASDGARFVEIGAWKGRARRMQALRLCDQERRYNSM